MEHKVGHRIEPKGDMWRAIVTVDYHIIDEREFAHHDEAYAWCCTHYRVLREALK